MKTFAKLLLPALLTAGLALSARAAVETYTIDPVHSSVSFSIRHFVSKVPGSFTKFNGVITVDRDNLEKSSAEATIDVGSLNTANEKRDGDVKGEKYLDTEKFPTMQFKSKSFKKTGEDAFDITGDLTLRGVTKEVVLKAHLLGFTEGMRGTQLMGWEATTTLKRSDFGVNGPAMISKVLGDDVAVTINIESDLKK